MVTIDQIARQAGVSKMTVSRVLNGRGKQSRASAMERAELIRRIAGELGYRPNAAAIATATGRFNNVSLLLGGTGRNPGFGWMPRSMLTGISQTLRANDITLSVAEVDDEHFVSDEFMPRTLRQWCTDGLLINYIVKMPDQLVDIIHRHRIPAVWTNVKLEDDCVHPDDVLAGRMATEHLLRLGHRSVGFISWYTPGGHYSEQDRLDGYRAAMAEAGLPTREVLLDQSQIDARPIDGGREWLERMGRPTGVVSNKEMDATRLMFAAHAIGLSVPRDLSIVTFPDDWSRQTDGLPWAGVEIPLAEVGRRAAEMLLKKIERPGRRFDSVALTPRLEPGQTAGPAPQS